MGQASIDCSFVLRPSTAPSSESAAYRHFVTSFAAVRSVSFVASSYLGGFARRAQDGFKASIVSLSIARATDRRRAAAAGDET